MAFNGDDGELVKVFGQEKFLLIRSGDSVSMSTITASADENAEISEDNMIEVRLRGFSSENDASVYQLKKLQDARLALPSAQFCFSGVQDRYFIATQKVGDDLKNLLGRRDVAEKLSNSCDGEKVSYSETYRRLVSDIVDLSIKLWEKGLAPKLDTSNVTLIVDPVSNMDHFTIRVLEVESKPNDPHTRGELVNFIERMNGVAGVEMNRVVSSFDLESVTIGIMGGCPRNVMFNKPFFWDHSRRMSFICALHTYLQRQQNILFCDALLRPFAQSWENKFRNDGILRHMLVQDGLDRVEYGTKGLLIIDRTKMTPQEIEEKNLRNWVDVMRQTYCHLVRMMSTLLGRKKISKGIDRRDLVVRYDKAFPNHIQRLKDRVDDLSSVGVCQVTYTQDGLFVIQ